MRRILLVVVTLAAMIAPGTGVGEPLPPPLARLLKSSDALLVTEVPQRVVFSQNADTPKVPASILKIATALFALDTLGETYRFPTDVALSTDHILCIKGYGDPLFTSEVIKKYAGEVAGDLKAMGIHEIDGIAVDDTYFGRITIPGVTSESMQPYDAPNGALCANFNTIAYTRNRSGVTLSGEPQTPLLPFVKRRIPAHGPSGRIHLTPEESRLYAGHLFRWFLEKQGITVGDAILPSPCPGKGQLYEKRFLSPWALPEAISKLMAHSNNFMSNQLFLASAAAKEGAPATLEKGRKAFCELMKKRIHQCPTVVEGSGISRDNTLSARTMDALLVEFAPHATLLRAEEGIRFKTGTLSDVSTRAGYLTTPDGRRYRFVILTQRNDANAAIILKALKTALWPDPSSHPKPQA